MRNILLFEAFKKEELDLENDIKNHLSQYPYLSYSIKKSDNSIIITFNKDVNIKYGLGILNMFRCETISKEPVSLKITGKKNVDTFDEYKGKVIIQNTEKVDFPEFGLKGIFGKVDSGAGSSSLASSDITIDKDKKMVSFVCLDDSYEEYTGKKITLPYFSIISVQSSSGETTERVLLQTKIIIKNKEIETFVSLADRASLDMAVLVGKDTLCAGNFLISPGL